MALYSQNKGLLCKVFPFGLGPTTMRWFNGLKNGSIHNFGEFIQAFNARFMTCSRVPKPIDAFLSMKMGSEETLWSYTNRYWELYNKISGNEQVSTSTFKLVLSYKSMLRDSLPQEHALVNEIDRGIQQAGR